MYDSEETSNEEEVSGGELNRKELKGLILLGKGKGTYVDPVGYGRAALAKIESGERILAMNDSVDPAVIELRDRLAELDGYKTPVGNVSLEKKSDGSLAVMCNGKICGSIYVRLNTKIGMSGVDSFYVREYSADAYYEFLGSFGADNGLGRDAFGGATIEQLQQRIDYFGLSMGLRQEFLSAENQLYDNREHPPTTKNPMFYKRRVFLGNLSFSFEDPVIRFHKTNGTDKSGKLDIFGGVVCDISAGEKRPYYTLRIYDRNSNTGRETQRVVLETDDPRAVKNFVDTRIKSRE